MNRSTPPAFSMTGGYYSNITDQPGGPHIRLLHLIPAVDRNSPIEARLDVAQLHDESIGGFEALSYVWGREIETGGLSLRFQTPSGEITPARHIDITVNLADALRHLRYADRTRTLWVDAVCINQGDFAEKAVQVGIMNRIYRRAQRVLIWMGPAGDRSDWVFTHINKVYENAAQGAREHESIEHGEADGSNTTDAILTLEETFAFAKLLNREWYTRVWVIQELCVAREVLVVCGDSSTPWDAIRVAFDTLNDSADAGQPSSLLNFGVSRHLALDRMRQKTIAGKLLGLDEALIRSRWSRATCALDKAYALLGISTADRGIVPDYAASTEACFESVTRAILLRSTIPDILDFVVCPAPLKKNPRLPSWVPDWSPENVSAQTEVGQTLADEYHLERMMKASDNSNIHDPPIGVFRPHFEGSSSSTMIIRGVEIGTIAALSKQIPGPWLGYAYSTKSQTDEESPRAKLEKEPETFAENWVFFKANWHYLVHNFKHTCQVIGKLVSYASTMANLFDLVGFTRRHSILADHSRSTIPPRAGTANESGGVVDNQGSNDSSGVTELSLLLTSNAHALVPAPPGVSNEDIARTLVQFLDPIWTMMFLPLPLRIYRGLYLHRLLPSAMYHGLICLTGSLRILYRNDKTYAHAFGALSLLTPWIGMRVAVVDCQNGTGGGTKKLLCLVPHTTAKGDDCVLIAGGRHPYIVRSRSQEDGAGGTRHDGEQMRLTLIGPCYLSIKDMALMRESWDGQGGKEMFIS